jgi:hypothetical protein
MDQRSFGVPGAHEQTASGVARPNLGFRPDHQRGCSRAASFASVNEFVRGIRGFLAERNANPKP